MSNEPVAWMHKTYFSNGLYEDDLVWSKIDENSIPLYTHPAKTLTDEEWELLKKMALIAWGTANECSPCAEEFCKQSQSDMLNLLEKTGAELKAMIEKHEAILRKAQEK